MLIKDDILKLETRREIYNLILKNPGLHFREIKRRTNLPIGSLQYHLSKLNKYGLIFKKFDNSYNRYYASKSVGKKETDIINLLRQKTPLKIILLLLCPGPGEIYKDKETYEKSLKKHKTYDKTYSKIELVELTKYWRKSDHYHIKRSITTITFHLKKLLDADIIEKVWVGRSVKYKLKEEDMIISLLIKYKDALSKKAIDEILEVMDEYNGGLNNIESVLLEILPNPYYV